MALGSEGPRSLGEPRFPQDPHDKDRDTMPTLQNPGALAHPEVKELLKIARSELLPSLLAVKSWGGEGDTGTLLQSVSQACSGLWTQAKASEPPWAGVGATRRCCLPPTPAHLSLPPLFSFSSSGFVCSLAAVFIPGGSPGSGGLFLPSLGAQGGCALPRGSISCLSPHTREPG